jgi:hypothetical protein
MNRLSPDNISDPLRRSLLYKDIRAGDESWPTYEVQPDEILMPELTALRHYGLDSLKWVVMIAAGLDEPRDAMEAGISLQLPPIQWIRQRILRLMQG